MLGHTLRLSKMLCVVLCNPLHRKYCTAVLLTRLPLQGLAMRAQVQTLTLQHWGRGWAQTLTLLAQVQTLRHWGTGWAQTLTLVQTLTLTLRAQTLTTSRGQLLSRWLSRVELALLMLAQVYGALAFQIYLPPVKLRLTTARMGRGSRALCEGGHHVVQGWVAGEASVAQPPQVERS